MNEVDKRFFGPETPFATMLAAAVCLLAVFYLWLVGMIVVLLGSGLAASTMTVGGRTRRIACGIVLGAGGVVAAAVIAVIFAVDADAG